MHLYGEIFEFSKIQKYIFRAPKHVQKFHYIAKTPLVSPKSENLKMKHSVWAENCFWIFFFKTLEFCRKKVSELGPWKKNPSNQV